MAQKENKLHLDKHILLYDETKLQKINMEECDYLLKKFCGRVFTDVAKINEINYDIIIYLFGNVGEILDKIENKNGKSFYVIKEWSHNYENILEKTIITVGAVPINIHNVGIFFRNFFDKDKNYFDLLNAEHQFQVLTESSKPGKSYRKGIYLTKVVENNDEINFNLLRCSTNLDGPTDNFRETDNEIIGKVNDICNQFFQQKTDLNHVLAQVYNNADIDGKQKKAKISKHSDKTKDMPINGLIAFCTFYQFDDKNLKEITHPKEDTYDCYYKKGSVLTRLRFRIKDSVKDPVLVKTFDVILYPNSVFVIPLSTNRLYTHEIVPSHLPIDKLPTRLGYVIRCSKTNAVFKDNQTYIEIHKNKWVKLQEPTAERVKHLKDTYFKENVSDELMDYGIVDFSLNDGDYLRPNL